MVTEPLFQRKLHLKRPLPRFLTLASLKRLLLLAVIFLVYELSLTLKSNYTSYFQPIQPVSWHQLLSSVYPSNVSVVKSRSDSSPKKILLWNKYWKSSTLWGKVFYQIIHQECPVSNCMFTTNKSEINSSHAVLFHLIDLPLESFKLPQRPNWEQVWIGMSFEPPWVLKYRKVNLKRYNGIFNRTMTYSRDADITALYGQVFPFSDTTRWPHFLGGWYNSRESIQTRNYALGKRRLAAWFATSHNCQSGSGREIYIKQLQDFVEVDAYGSCGPYKCGSRKTLMHPYKVEYDDCYMLISQNYKFYLGFENSICEDYVTEKLFNHLKLNVVPIVFGGADYGKLAPPHSFIDATKFTPKQLAEYLKLLDSNDTLYNEYFAWKSNYYVESHDGVLMVCDLCAKLNDPQWLNQVKVYDHFDTWFESGCSPGYTEEDGDVPYGVKYWNETMSQPVIRR